MTQEEWNIACEAMRQAMLDNYNELSIKFEERASVMFDPETIPIPPMPESMKEESLNNTDYRRGYKQP